MSRIRVIEPGTGVVVEVEESSVLATRWARADEDKPAPKRRTTAAKED